MMDERTMRVIELMIKEDFYVTLDQLAKSQNISKRSVYNVLDEANRWLSIHGFSPIMQIRGKGYQLNKKEVIDIQHQLFAIKTTQLYTVKERQALCLFALLTDQKGIMIEHLTRLVQVSRNTLFNDLKQIRQTLNTYGLDLNFVIHEGYQITGDVIRRRSTYLFYYFSVKSLLEQLPYDEQNVFVFQQTEAIGAIYHKLKKIEKQLETQYVIGTLASLSYLIHIMLVIPQAQFELTTSHEYLRKTREYQLLQDTFPILPTREIEYLTLHLLGSRTQIYQERSDLPLLTSLAAELVDAFERIAAIQFTMRTTLIKQISSHLSISYFRYHYGIHHGNPLLEQIKEQYLEVFELTNRACDVIRIELEVPVSEGEVAFLTLYFNSYLRKSNYLSAQIVVDIVCPSGMATANMLRTEIENLHSNIHVRKVMNLIEFNEQKEVSTVVISTIGLDHPNTILVNPILNQDDRMRILQRLHLKSTDTNVSNIDSIMVIISPYIAEHDRTMVRQELTQYFSFCQNKGSHQNLLNMKDVMHKEFVRYRKQAASWQEAVHVASQPLIDNSIISPSYIDAIINATLKHGPYMMLEHGYMLAHATNHDGVNQLGLSFLKLKHAVFYENRKIDKILVLAPVDQHQHLSVMKDILRILSDDMLPQRLDRASCEVEVYQILIDFLGSTDFAKCS